MNTFLQHLAPQRALTALAGWLAECRTPWLKSFLINYFLQKYPVDLASAIITDKNDYPTFNSLFTRHLKPELRPITPDPQHIASPVDGCVSQLGFIQKTTLLQAKGFHFELAALLGSSERAQQFQDGAFATLYLAPKDYHRIHMPLTGTLTETIFIPGKLFSVNQNTARSVENLFARNERLVCFFDTTAGPMAVILVGAMLVGSINTVWETNISSSQVKHQTHENIKIDKGAEMGHFKMGSTVIVLFARNKVEWSEALEENSAVLMGQLLGNIKDY